MQRRNWTRGILLAVGGLVLFAAGAAAGAVGGFLFSMMAALGAASMADRNDSVVARTVCSQLLDIKGDAAIALKSAATDQARKATERIVRSSVEGLTLCRDKDVILETYEEIQTLK